MFRTHPRIISLVSSKNWRGSICLFITVIYYRINQYTAFESRIYHLPTKSRAVFGACTYETSTQWIYFKPSTCQSNDYLISIDNRGRLIRLRSMTRWTRHINVLMFPTSMFFSHVFNRRPAPANHVPFAAYRSAAQDFQLGYWQAYLNFLFLCVLLLHYYVQSQMLYQISKCIKWHMSHRKACCDMSIVLEKDHWLMRELS